MEFLELALFGFRNFSSLSRFSFKPGLNLIQGENGTGKTAIQEAIFSILSPEEPLPLSRFKRPGSKNECQAGLVIKLKDGRMIRIVRDLGADKITLAQLDDTKHFKVIKSKPAEIAVFLSEQIGGIPSRSLKDLYLIAQSHLPSSRNDLQGGFSNNGSSDPGKPGSGSGSGPVLPGTREFAEKKARLEELKKHLEQADKLAAMEDDLANVQSSRAEVSRQIRIAEEKNEQIRQMEQESQGMSQIGELPKDHHLIIETAEQQEALKYETLNSLEEEMDFTAQELESIPREPFFLNKLFIGGGVITLAAILSVIVLELTSLIQNLLMLPLLGGIALMAYIGFMDFMKANKRKSLERKLKDGERKKKGIEKKFEKDNAAFLTLLGKTGCQDVKTLKEKIGQYDNYLQQRKLIESERDQILKEKTLETLEAEQKDFSKKIEQIESDIKNAAVLPSDIYLMQEECRGLEKQLAGLNKETSGPEEETQLQSPEPSAPTPSSPGGHGDLLSESLKNGLTIPPVKNFLFGKVSEALAVIRKLVENIGGPIDNQLELNDDLTPKLATPSKEPLPWDALSAGQQDLFYLAVQLGYAKVLEANHSFPIILDNPFTTLDPRRQQAMLDILKEISQNRQVILLSSSPYPVHPGANSITLR